MPNYLCVRCARHFERPISRRGMSTAHGAQDITHTARLYIIIIKGGGMHMLLRVTVRQHQQMRTSAQSDSTAARRDQTGCF